MKPQDKVQALFEGSLGALVIWAAVLVVQTYMIVGG